MRYTIVGRVLPERANAWFDRQVWRAADGTTFTASADASQLTVVAEYPRDLGPVDVFVSAEQVAQAIVSALGFASGTGYTAELVQMVSATGDTAVLGVRPGNLHFDDDTMFAQASDLAKKDVFFRMALRDYCRAMSQTLDGALYCYRAIEAIESSFASGLGKDGWAAMHSTLGTTRVDIEMFVKDFADPVRHGNWSSTKVSTAADRNNMMLLTREILVRYMRLKAAQQ